MLPEAIRRGGEAGLGETDLAPEEIAVREGHDGGRAPLRVIRVVSSAGATVIRHDVRGHGRYDQVEPAEQDSSEAIGLDGEVGGEVLVVRGDGTELLAQLNESLDLITAELVDGFVIVPGYLVRVDDSSRSEDVNVGLLRCGLLRRGFLCW